MLRCRFASTSISVQISNRHCCVLIWRTHGHQVGVADKSIVICLTVVETWTVKCPVQETESQPQSLVRESASFLRLKTRSISTDQLSEALSSSLSLDERKLFSKYRSGDLEAPLLTEWEEELDGKSLHQTLHKVVMYIVIPGDLSMLTTCSLIRHHVIGLH